MELTRTMRRGKAWHWCAALALASGLVACGGGGGGGGLGRPASTVASSLTGDQEVPPVITGAVGSGTLTLQGNTLTGGGITLDGLVASAAHIHIGDIGVDGPVIVPLSETAPGTWSVPVPTVLTEEQRIAFLEGRLYFNAHTAANPDGEIRGQIGRDVFNVSLSPRYEVPPVPSAAFGSGRLVLDPATRKFTATLAVSGMAATAAHIHIGAVGVDGPILFPLAETPAGSGVFVAAADATLTEAQLASLRAGELYFNAHSLAFPDGEIRGQIGRLVGVAFMSGPQEVPPTPSTATGTGTLVVDPLTRAASGSFTVTGMTTTDAHIHLAPVGIDGPIIVPLAQTATNLWSVPANTRLSVEHFAAFKRGELYYNAHSVAFPGGEIRGQIR